MFGEEGSGEFHDGGEVFLGAFLETRHVEETVPRPSKAGSLHTLPAFRIRRSKRWTFSNGTVLSAVPCTMKVGGRLGRT